MDREETDIHLSHKEFLSLDRDYAKTAAAVDLVYVNDSDTGENQTPGNSARMDQRVDLP